ncbi:MAG: hypothetical protein HRU15_11495, partial [Planctomycetes bacterium]|nr:hypothetical protein [Planctomycetota bacterium]
WNVSTPHNFAVFPAIARQVRRHDIKTTEKHIPLNVHLDSLHTGQVGFTDTTEQAYDIKSFTTDKVSSRALAVSRIAVTYTDEYTDTQAFDLQAHIKNGALHSLTGELAWYEGTETDSGYFTINSPATKAVVGFAKDTEHVLGDVSIKSHSKYGALYVTAQSKEGTIATDKRLVIIAIARSHNTGMKYMNGKLMAKGKAPILMEPMKATITLKRAGTPTVYICDHDGNRTDKTISVKDASFLIDGSTSKAVYYEIVYP